MLTVREVSIRSLDAQGMIALLDRELREEYATEHMHPVDFDHFECNGGIFVVGYAEDLPVACGGLRMIDEASIELKRMFVAASHRGRGYSRQVLKYLENKARGLGYRKLLLETGDRQQAAIGLYSSSGFRRVAAFGEYAASSRSVCFEKNL